MCITTPWLWTQVPDSFCQPHPQPPFSLLWPSFTSPFSTYSVPDLKRFFFNKFFPAETTGTIQTALTLFCILVSLLSQITGLYGSSDSSHFSFSLIFSLSCITLMSTVNGSLLLLDDDMIYDMIWHDMIWYIYYDTIRYGSKADMIA